MKKVASIILASLAIFSIVQVHAQYGTGLTFGPPTPGKYPTGNPAKLGFASEVPASYSMRQYTPYVKSQGVYPSCAGWSSSYEAMSTQFAIANGITNRNLITAKAFCPYYSYNKANPGDRDCKNGTSAGDIMKTLMDEGGKKFYLPLLGCGSTVTTEFGYASQYYKVKAYYELPNIWPETVTGTDLRSVFQSFFSTPHPMDFKVIKQLVSNQHPVVCSFALPTSFYYVKGELWEPTAEEKGDPTAAVMTNTGGHRAHSMAVIGYDDTKFGGAFEVMNSWSENWGDNGYFWVKYDDFKTFVYGAYYMEVFPVEAEMAAKTGVVWGDCMNGYGMARGNGETYEGQWANGKFEGYGVYSWPNGLAYAGQWKAGKREGEATVYYPDGSFGQATYADDKFVSGFNVLTFKNGDSYRGYIKNGMFDGYGEYRFANGARILSMFANDKMHGLAKVFEADGSTFLGFYSEGKRHGKGVHVSADKKISAGEWSYGVYQKQRTFGFANTTAVKTGVGMSSTMYLAADCLSGNCLIGEGKRTTGNGNTYTGVFVDGLEDGKGEMVYPTMTYTGSWRQSKHHGIGEKRYNEGVSVIAEFNKGVETGYILVYNAAGDMAVSLVENGIEVAVYKEITSSSSAPTGSSIPAKRESIPSVVSKLK